MIVKSIKQFIFFAKKYLFQSLINQRMIHGGSMKKYNEKNLLYSVIKFSHLLILYMLMSFAVTQVMIVASNKIAKAVDELFAGKLNISAEFLIPFFILALLGMIVSYLKSFSGSMFSARVQNEIKSTTVHKLVRLKYRYIDEKGSGSIMNKLISDVFQLEQLFTNSIPQLIVGFITIIAVGIYIYTLNYRLVLVSFICYPVLLMVANWISKKVKKLAGNRRELYDKMEETVLDTFHGMIVGRSYNLYNVMKMRISDIIDDILENEFNRVKIHSFSIVLGNLIKWIPTVICYLFALKEVLDGNLTVGEMLAYAILIERIVYYFGDIPSLLNTIREEWVSFKRIDEIMKQPEEQSGTGSYFAREEEPIISVENLKFSYDSKRVIFEDLNFKINKGENIAFVGSSGGGKSTVFKILCGLYKQTQGQYRLYGHSFDEWDCKEARKQFSFVSQTVFLFPDTIAANVAYGKEGATKEDVIEACKLANIHDFIIKLPKGYETFVGERGVKLSGGQRQRISIARAFLKEAPIILLDEPTSAVDMETESLIQEALERITKGKTVITIAHRLSTIKYADSIFVFSDGRIVEDGDHETLLSANGVYSQLYLKESQDSVHDSIENQTDSISCNRDYEVNTDSLLVSNEEYSDGNDSNGNGRSGKTKIEQSTSKRNSMNSIQRNKKNTLIRLMSMMKHGFWFYLVAIFAMGTAMAIFHTITAFLMKEIIQMAQEGSATGLGVMIIKSILTGIFALFIYQVGFIIYTIEAKKGCATLQRSIFFKSMKLPYDYYENTHSGDFMSKLMYDGDRASDVYGSRFRRILMPFIMVVCYLIPMLFLSWQITLGLMGICILTFIVNGMFIKPMKRISKKLSKVHAQLTENLSNILAGMEMIKVFGLDDVMVSNYVSVNQEFLKKQRKKNRMSAGLDSLNTCFDLLSSIVFIAVGLFLVSNDITTVDKLAAIYMMYGSLSWNFLQIGIYIPDIANCLVNANRVFEFLDMREEPITYKGRKDNTEPGYIVMEHVDFSYDLEDADSKSENGEVILKRKILNDFSMNIAKGDIVALKGESGKGKSTIAKLLMGFYPIQEGSISIAGKPFQSMSLEEIRNMIAYVPQEPYLYNVSISENISYGKPGASMEEIISAAKLANAHDFILKQEQGYDTIAGERGNRLSGGEKQRIAIARAILKNSPILILDEATSALDNESERLVSEALGTLMKGRTTIMIAHRLSTLERADRIIEII